MSDLASSGSPTLLVGTDFSPASAVAFAWAQAIARAHHAAIDLVHALSLPLPAGEMVSLTPEFLDEVERAAWRKLEEIREKVDPKDCAVRLRLAPGQPSQVLLDFAHSLAPELIVLGTRGLTGLRRFLLGSTTERVVQHSPVPVLAVHPENRQPEKSLRTIVVPTDFSADAERAIATALRLLSPVSEARLILLHIYNLPIEYTAYGPIPLSASYLRDVGAQAVAHLDEVAASLARPGLAIEPFVREGYPPEVITAEAERQGADLIAMGTRGRSGLPHLLLGSTAERVVQTAGCPVLTVRRGG